MLYYNMIKSFKQSWLEDFWNTGKNKKVPGQLKERLLRKLDMINSVKELSDLNSPPSNHLHSLHGDRADQWSISVSSKWRLCFTFKDGDIFGIEFVQYH